jgi:uncharacterized protein (TIGR02246 family)
MPRPHLAIAAVPLVMLAACTPTKLPPAADTTSATVSAPAASDRDAVRRQIEAADSQMAVAMGKGDTVGMYAAYADDAVMMMPGSAAMHGRAEMTKAMNVMMAQMTLKDPKFHIEDVLVGGDLAVETGTYEWTVQPKKGKAFPDKGKYITIWQRQGDGSWKIVRDISNSDRAGT